MVRSALAVLALLTLVPPASATGQATRRTDTRREILRIEALERAGQVSEALEALNGLLADEPALPGAVVAYERISRRLGQTEKLIPVVEQAIRFDPNSTLLRQVELRALTELGWIDALREAGSRWIAAAPGSDVAYREYAGALQQVGEWREAEAVLQVGARESERPVAIAVELADFYTTYRRWTEAARQWVFVIDSSPGLAWDLVAVKLEALGRDAVAVARTLLGELETGDGSADRRRIAALAAVYADRPDLAIEIAESLLDGMEARPRQAFVNRLADVGSRRNEPSLVAWSYRWLLRELPHDASRWEIARRIVRFDLSAGDTAAALGVLAELLGEPGTEDPGYRWASQTQVELFAASGRVREAQRAFRRHADRYRDDPEFPALALMIAEAHLRSGDVEEAEDVLEIVPRTGLPREISARLSAVRGQLALFAGRYAEARGELELAVTGIVGESRGPLLRLLGFLRDGNEGELEAVSQAYRAKIEGRPREAYRVMAAGLEAAAASSARPGLLVWAGELAVEAGAMTDAERLLRRVAERYPSSGAAPVALMRLAEALVAAGRPSEAIVVLETLILDYPDSAMAPLGRRRLAELREQVPRS